MSQLIQLIANRSFHHFLLQGYDDGYGGEYDDQTYETYDNSYATQTQR